MTDSAAVPMDVAERLLADPAALRALLLAALDRAAKEAPKVRALDRIATAAGDWCITDAAKSIGVSPKRMIEYLEAYRWTYRRRHSNRLVAYATRIKAGLLCHRIITITGSEGKPKSVSSVRVTAKGLAILARAFSQPQAEGDGQE